MDLLNRLAPNRQSPEKLTLGQRFERSIAGEAMISGLVFVVVFIGIVWNLPASHLKDALTPTLRPVAASTGLQQQWMMYGPDPVSAREDLEVRVTMADQSVRRWQFQKGDRVIGPFVWYHRQKLKEQVARERHIAADMSRWLVRELTAPGERPTRVVMTLRMEFLPAPGETVSPRVTMETLHDEALDGRS